MSTYSQEMKAKFPDRPYIARATYELRNMMKALRIMRVLNSPEEEQRLADVARELEIRAKNKED